MDDVLGMCASDPKLEEARVLAQQVDPEPAHAFHVCAIALTLFDQTAPLHGLGDWERRMLAAAALLHDTGWSIRAGAHHKGSRDIILAAPLDVFEKREREIIALVARYHRKAHPRPSHGIYRDLGDGDRVLVGKLAALLRIADGLDRSHCGSTQALTVERGEGSIGIFVRQRRPNRIDLWGAMRKRRLFEEIFGVEVEIAEMRHTGGGTPSPANE